MCAQQRGKWEVDEKIECRICRERVEIDGNVEVFEGSCQKRVRQDGDEVLCAERAVATAGMD